MDAMVLEWCFDCDQASEAANDVFDTVMDRGWLLEHGIHPFDTDAAWEEVRKHLSRLGEPSVLTAIRITQGNATADEQRHVWSMVYRILPGGEK